jgi:hypothetical protein
MIKVRKRDAAVFPLLLQIIDMVEDSLDSPSFDLYNSFRYRGVEQSGSSLGS